MTFGERALKRRFDALRRDDAHRAPGFEETLRAARPRPSGRSSPRPLPLPAVALGVAAAVAIGLLLLGPPPERAPRPDPARVLAAVVDEWTAPTDALLASPGPRPVLRGIDLDSFDSPTAELLDPDLELARPGRTP